mgnify:CR=1 FL=1
MNSIELSELFLQSADLLTRLGRAAEPSGNIWETMCFD